MTEGTLPDLDELARISAELESEPASSAIKWAWEEFGTGAVLAASFQDCVLIDVATQVVPEIEVVFLDTQYHFAETLWYVEQVRERYDLNLRIITPQVQPDNLWQVDPDECCAMRKVEPLSRRARRQVGVAHRAAARRGVHPHPRADRRLRRRPRDREGEPDRHVVPRRHRGLHRRSRPAGTPAARQGLPVDRVLAVHQPGARRRRPAVGALGRQGQARVRPARLDPLQRLSRQRLTRSPACIPSLRVASTPRPRTTTGSGPRTHPTRSTGSPTRC